jgi:hypothetical protein
MATGTSTPNISFWFKLELFVTDITNQFFCNPLRLSRIETFISSEIKECARMADDV